MKNRARSHAKWTTLFAAAGAGAALLLPARAEASLVDSGAQGGIEKRSLADTSYNTGFVWQLNADLTFFPLLMMGPYITLRELDPRYRGRGGVEHQLSHHRGSRETRKSPSPATSSRSRWRGPDGRTAISPTRCSSSATRTRVPSKTLPNATANFAEFLLGGGVLWEAAGPLTFSLELNWRPTTGYKNDVYEQQAQSQSTTAPEPSRNGAAWVGMLGIGVSF